MDFFYYLVKIAAITLQIFKEFDPSQETDKPEIQITDKPGIQTTDKLFTTFKSVWSMPGFSNFEYAFKDLPQVKEDGWDLVRDGCDDTYMTKRYLHSNTSSRSINFNFGVLFRIYQKTKVV